MKKEVTKRRLLILVTATVLGVFVALQSQSFESVSENLLRDNQTNIFQEIQILKNKNTDLQSEISELELTLEQLSNQSSALDAIKEQIIKYKKLEGTYPIFGPGVNVKISNELSVPWAIDIINELFNAGAQAVSINGIRITNLTSGFDSLPKGTILINGSVLKAPYEFKVIGEPADLLDILNLPGGVFSRFKNTFSGASIDIVKKDILEIN